jgi:plastocyanin
MDENPARRMGMSTKMKRLLNICRVGGMLVATLALTMVARAQTVTVTAHVEITTKEHPSHASSRSSANVVFWLTPLKQNGGSPVPHEPHIYKLAQKNKEFIPHILVVPTGSSVDFPNLDPFFHNVFSLFNGKRFDLGLYDAQTHRVVQFDREGISYIFCNIHPEMGAVVVSLSTPYFGVSAADGSVTISGVPPGSYRLNLWAENVAVNRLDAQSRVVEISPQNSRLGDFHFQASGDIMAHHENKFGEAYQPVLTSPY